MSHAVWTSSGRRTRTKGRLRRSLQKRYSRILLKFRGKRFAWLFNLRASFRKLDVRLAYCESTGRYCVSEANRKTLYVRQEYYVNLAYSNGIRERGEYLGREYLLNRIDFSNGDLVLDCGAYVGDLLLWFQNRDIRVRYIGFEPSPKSFECLRENVSPHEVFNVGLWNKRGKLDFFLRPTKQDSSFIEPMSYERVISVPAEPLAAFVSERVKLLKLEAEGGEPEVLEGLSDKLRLIEYIAADLGPERGKGEETTLAPVTNYLLQRDFSLEEVGRGRLVALYRNRALQKVKDDAAAATDRVFNGERGA